MKKLLLVSFISVFFCITAFSQFTFSVSPGLNLNSANFGYKLNRFVPFIGVQYAGISFNLTNEFKEFDFSTGELIDQKIAANVNVNLILPNIGTKYFFVEQDKLKAFGCINIAVPIFLTSFDFGDAEIEDDLNEAIYGATIWGVELSFGAEYFFSSQFSISGEFGMRSIRFGYKESFDRFIFNPSTGQNLQTQSAVDGNFSFSPSFSRVSLNFYFGTTN